MPDHFHPCAFCGEPCECTYASVPFLPELLECLGCGREECPGNEDDPEVQGEQEAAP